VAASDASGSAVQRVPWHPRITASHTVAASGASSLVAQKAHKAQRTDASHMVEVVAVLWMDA